MKTVIDGKSQFSFFSSDAEIYANTILSKSSIDLERRLNFLIPTNLYPILMIYLLYICRTIGNNLELLAAGQKYFLSVTSDKHDVESHLLCIEFSSKFRV